MNNVKTLETTKPETNKQIIKRLEDEKRYFVDAIDSKNSEILKLECAIAKTEDELARSQKENEENIAKAKGLIQKIEKENQNVVIENHQRQHEANIKVIQEQNDRKMAIEIEKNKQLINHVRYLEEGLTKFHQAFLGTLKTSQGSIENSVALLTFLEQSYLRKNEGV